MTCVIVSEFNEILSSFLVQIIPIIGSSYQNNLKTIIKCNSTLPIENFLYYAIEHREDIMNKDERYFCDRKEMAKSTNRNDKLAEIFELQNIWELLDIDSKDSVWEIFQALLILGDDYIKIKYSNNYEKSWQDV